VAKLLIQEIKTNQKYLKGLASLKDLMDDKGVLHDNNNKPLVKASHLEWLRPSYLQSSIFTATLQQQGLFNGVTLESLHTFYDLIRNLERFVSASEDKTNSKATRIGFARDAFKTASSALKLAEDSKLILKLEAEGSFNPIKRFRARKVS
jgi:hypothetical protein